MIDPVRCCGTCASWSNVQPACATGIRRALGADTEVGICRRRAPTLLSLAGVPVTLFPEIHCARVCDDWTESVTDGPDGGEVVTLRVVA